MRIREKVPGSAEVGAGDRAVSGRDGALSLGKETFGRTGADQAVRVLSQREKGLTRPLYEGCFPEDGPALTDFYYREKMADNTVLCRFSPEGVPLGMLCLNPYRVRVFDQERCLSYIVAVATDASCRRQGIMRSVLQEALSLETRVTPETPPTFLWHTVEDDTVPVENSLLYAAACRRNGVPFELHIYEHGGHGISTCQEITSTLESQIMPDNASWVPHAVRFLLRHWSEARS